MPSGQVSIWVPVVVAVLGIVGIISGQLINAWREDRRWQRELKREDLRWQRERERDQERHEIERSRESLRLAHDARIEWRVQRFEVYKAFVTAVDDLVRSMPALNPMTDSYLVERAYRNPEFGSQMYEGLKAVQESAVAIEVLAGGELASAAENLLQACEAARYGIMLPPRAPRRKDSDEEEPEVDWEDLNEHHAHARQRLEQMRTEFISNVKRELALVTAEEGKGSN